MAIDASNGYIYLGTWNKGVMRSVDDGRTWTTLGLSGKYLRGIALDAANPQVLYVAAANEGVYVTTSARGTGSLALLAGSPKTPEELAIVDNVLWVAAGTAGVFKGTGSGGSRTFSKAAARHQRRGVLLHRYGVQAERIGGRALRRQLQGTEGRSLQRQHVQVHRWWCHVAIHHAGSEQDRLRAVGGYRALVAQESEPCFRIGKPCYVASQIVIDPANPQIVYATGRSGAWRLDNGGENWRPAVRGIGATITRGAAVEASGDNVFVALADYVLIQSSDNGVNFERNSRPWATSATAWPSTPGDRILWSTSPRVSATPTPRAICGATTTRSPRCLGVGGHWREVGNKRIMGVALVPKDGGGRILFAAVDGGGLWRKEDNGAWAKVSSEISATAATGGNDRRVVRGVSASNGVLYAYDPYRGVYRSTDLGLTWERIWAKASIGVFTGFMSVDPQNPGTLYVAPGDSVYRIDGADKGTVGSGLTAVNLNVPRPGPVYVASDRSVWTVQQVTQAEPATLLRSTDRGASWVRVDDPVWRGQVATATGLAFNTGDGDPAKGRAFVTTDGTGMLIAKFVRSGTPDDLEQPTAVMQRPAEGTTLPQGETLTVSGTASDNVGVTGVDVVILRYDDEVQGYLQADGSFGGEQGARLPATLSNPGGTTTNWTFSTALPGGSYYAFALARDAAGNETIDVPVRGFAVLSPGANPTRPPRPSPW